MVYSDNVYSTARMIEKRRPGPAHLVGVILILSVILLLWRNSGCPGPPVFSSEPPGYLIVLPGNASTLPAPYILHALPPDDKKRLIDLTNFEFLIDNSFCNASEPLLIVLVHSEPNNVDKRRAIRSTWGSELKVLFLLGNVDDSLINRKLMSENEEHHDLIQGNFMDAYRNMTYKHVMGLKWTTYHCPGARYLLKTDDDVFVYPSALLHYLRYSLSPHGARRLILCQALPYGVVRRSYRSKWRVAFSEYRSPLYPPYCQGWAILYSPDVVFRLYLESQSAQYFWIDDVFVTGLMAARANYAHFSLGDFVLSQERANDLPNKSPNSDYFLFGPPNIDIDQVYKLWKTVKSWSAVSKLS